MQHTIRHSTFVIAAALIVGAIVAGLWYQSPREDNRSLEAVKTLARLSNAVNEKESSTLNKILAEQIVIKAGSGEKSSEWILSRPELVTIMTRTEISSFDAMHPRTRLNGDKIDIQVFLRTTFHSETRDLRHQAEHVFTFAPEGKDWKLVEITRNDSPITFWQVIRYAPDLVMGILLELLY